MEAIVGQAISTADVISTGEMGHGVGGRDVVIPLSGVVSGIEAAHAAAISQVDHGLVLEPERGHGAESGVAGAHGDDAHAELGDHFPRCGGYHIHWQHRD